MAFRLSDEYWAALKVSAAFQVSFCVLMGLSTAHGLFALWLSTMAGYWGGLLVMMMRRPDKPTGVDLFLIRWGFPILFFFVAMPLVILQDFQISRRRGYMVYDSLTDLILIGVAAWTGTKLLILIRSSNRWVLGRLMALVVFFSMAALAVVGRNANSQSLQVIGFGAVIVAVCSWGYLYSLWKLYTCVTERRGRARQYSRMCLVVFLVSFGALAKSIWLVLGTGRR